MEIILCALPCEAKPIAKYFNLSKIDETNVKIFCDKLVKYTSNLNNYKFDSPIQIPANLPKCYFNTSDNILLFEIGFGPKLACKNTSIIMDFIKYLKFIHNPKYAEQPYTNYWNVLSSLHVYNVGTCAGSQIGKDYLASKVIDETTNKTYYPDLIHQNLFELCTLITRSKPAITSDVKDANNKNFTNIEHFKDKKFYKNIRSDICFDMEAAAVFKAVSKLLSPNKITILKSTSDLGITEDSNQTNFKELEKIFIQNMENIAPKLEQLMQKYNNLDNKFISTSNQTKNKATNNLLIDEEKICKDLRCSQTAAIQLKHKLKYCKISDIDSNIYFNKLYDEGKIPASNKQQTSTIIKNFQEFIDEQ